MDEISSPANPRVKWLVALRKRSTRDTGGVTLVEGYAEIVLAVESGVEASAVFCCPSLVTEKGQLALLDRLAGRGTDVVTLSLAAFEKASYRESPDGWLAVVPSPGRPIGALTLGEPPLVLVAESVEKPGNLGAMLRTADAAGVDAVIAASPVTDWGNPNVVRASRGTVFSVPVASATTEATMSWLREIGLTTVVATPEAERLVTDVDLTRGVAIVVGAEHSGVSGPWLAAPHVAAAIPMSGRVNSLNVATSAAIVVYEAVRQRSLAGRPQGS